MAWLMNLRRNDGEGWAPKLRLLTLLVRPYPGAVSRDSPDTRLLPSCLPLFLRACTLETSWTGIPHMLQSSIPPDT